jgi:hypothetical protein
MRVIPGTLLFVLLLGAAANVGASTITAASCTASDVQAALNQASAGDTVLIPAGTCHWTSGIVWTAPANATVRGAGSLTTLGGGDATIIIDDSASGSPLLSIIANASGTCRVAGITIQGGTGAVKDNGIIAFFGTSKQLRVDHNHIDKTTYSVQNTGKLMLFGGTLAGVVDHNLFDPSAPITWLHMVNGNNNDAGNGVWAAPTGFGGSDFLFLEDNQLNGVLNRWFNPPVSEATLTDCHTGGRYVARYNTIVNGAVGQTHPTGHAGNDRGCRAHELYGNTVTSTANPATDQPNFTFEYNNSGPAMVWGNSFDQVYKNIFYFNVIRRNRDTYAQTATPNGWGYCGTQFNGTGSNWDGNTDSASGYPCLDQPGRGQGDLLSGNANSAFIGVLNTATGTIAWPHQALDPIYEWLNVGTIVPGWGGSYNANQTPSRIAQNRDYYLYTASFIGTVGVGSGTRAARPATCTIGVAYWSTDQGGNWNGANGTANDGTLDVCTATNTWTNAVYTPYPYPHPLTQTPLTQTQPQTGLPAPTNLTVK